jgi:hypothetical protein
MKCRRRFPQNVNDVLVLKRKCEHTQTTTEEEEKSTATRLLNDYNNNGKTN